MSAPNETRFSLTLTQKDGYAFWVDFGLPGVPVLELDEPPPLGKGEAPNAARILAAAIGNCLSASLLFCLRRAHIDVKALHTTVEGTLVRNEQGRFRVGEINVSLDPDVPPDERERMTRCLALFQDFCIVTESVRKGITVNVEVKSAAEATVP